MPSSSFILLNDTFDEGNKAIATELFRDCLDRLYTLTCEVSTNGDAYYIDDQVYSTRPAFGRELIEWAYDPNLATQLELQTEQQVIQTLLTRGASFNSHQDYINALNKSHVRAICDREALIGLYTITSTRSVCTSRESITNVFRGFITQSSDIEEFLEVAPLAYPRLLLPQSLRQTLKTLTEDFSLYKAKIAAHLEALNDRMPAIFDEHRTRGEKYVLDVFASATGIVCSPEGDSERVRKDLTFAFTNELGEVRDIGCSPHTKLEGTGNPGDTHFRQDRIYFGWSDGFVSDKDILIGHIGGHL